MKLLDIDLRILKVVFIGISVLLFILATEAFMRINAISNTSRLLNQHTNNKALILNSYNTFKDVETATRGYIHLKDSLFLSIRERAISSQPVIFEQLEQSIENRPIEQYYFNILFNLYQNRTRDLNMLLSTNDSTLQQMVLSKSPKLTEEYRITIDKMLAQEDNHIKRINASLKRNINSAPITILILIFIFLITLLVSYLSIASQLQVSNKLQRNYEDSNFSLELANKSLSQSQQFLKSLLATNPNGILLYEALRNNQGKIEDFKVIFASGKLGVLGGSSPEDIIGAKVSDLYPLLKTTDFYSHLINVTETGVSEFFEFYYPPDGNVGGWYEILLSKHNDGVTLNGRNISNIKMAEQELKKTIELLNERNKELDERKNYSFTVFNALVDAIVTLDVNLIITSANSAFYNYTNLNESIIGKSLPNDILKNKNFDFDLTGIEKALHGDTFVKKEYYSSTLKRYLDSYAIPLKNNYGIVYGVVIIFHNIDEQVKAKREINNYVQELKQANEQLKHFTFISSHDLQEPLRKIQIFSNKLIEKFSDNKATLNDLKKIKSSATRMSDLITSITKYSHLHVSETVLQYVDLNTIYQKVQADLSTQIKEKQAVIKVDNLPTIKCDPSQMYQLFINLISNSIKFCRKSPEIDITCTEQVGIKVIESSGNDNKYYLLKFSDNGIGFKNEFSDKLFLIFQRLHDTNSFPGIGIGLAICHKIVENHKGRIMAYSKENEGSTFDVYLPANLTFSQP
jgi:signal transduction histidine kinase/CHASE3 domain sensor protein